MKHEMCETCSTNLSFENAYRILIGNLRTYVRPPLFWVIYAA